MEFSGAKLALFLGSDLLVIRRDDRPDIPWPDHWDLPGGGREGSETAAQCVLRETYEEVGLTLHERDLVWARCHQRPQGSSWFFAAHRPRQLREKIVFGNEGQGWRLMPVGTYCEHDLAVPHLAEQIRMYLSQKNG
ncbi:NUDIX hydrolase [Sedimentitalea sp. XS_ASV28]|uniref:NUDIX hydrolase n=1 Tax=Sedimentitalea sp. XS_ASV28 TaxID=3241296 RepID=UPI00351283AD